VAKPPILKGVLVSMVPET